MKKNNNKAGITLIEILIYVALLTTILALITNFFYDIASFKINNQIESALLQNSNLILTKISQDIRLADSISIPSDESLTSNLILNTGSDQIEYQVLNGVLQRNGEPISDNLVEVKFDGPDYGFRKIGSTVQIKMFISPKLRPFGRARKQEIYQTSVCLR